MRCVAVMLAAVSGGELSAAEAHDAVPNQFQGTWAASLTQCSARSTTSKLVISEKRIAFYESHGPILAIASDGEFDLALILELSGEGETWLETRQFKLSEDRQTLTDVTGRRQLMTRVRCNEASQ